MKYKVSIDLSRLYGGSVWSCSLSYWVFMFGLIKRGCISKQVKDTEDAVYDLSLRKLIPKGGGGGGGSGGGVEMGS